MKAKEKRRRTKEMHSLLGKVSSERGRESETRVITAFAEEFEKPAWFRKVYKADRALDKKGVDIVVLSDVGKLFIQIKSSSIGKRIFLGKNKNPMIGVVVILLHDDEKIIRNKILAEANWLRTKVLRLRK